MTEDDLLELPEYHAARDQPLLDRPRLELAAALDSLWPERATFIRVSLLEHRMQCCLPTSDEATGLPAGRFSAFQRKAERWPQPSWLAAMDTFGFSRGLIEFIALEPATLLADDRRVLKRLPILYLSVGECTMDDIAALAAAPELARVIFLQVSAREAGDAGLRLLLGSPYIQNVRLLDFSSHVDRLTVAGYEMVAEASKTTLPRLETAHLSQVGFRNELKVAKLEELFEARHGAVKWLWRQSHGNIRRFEQPLDIEDTPLRIEEALGVKPRCAIVERELMEMPEYVAALAAPLEDGPRLLLANVLDPIWPERAAYIRFAIFDHREEYFRQPSDPRFALSRAQREVLERSLEPCWTPPFDTPVKEFGRIRGLVERIHLSACGLRADGLNLLERFPILHLRVDGCSRDDLRRLARIPQLARLISLDVRAPGVGDAGLRELLASEFLGNVKTLSVAGAGLTMEGYEAVALATKTTLKGLEVGYLSGNTIDDPQEREPSYDGYSGAPIYETVGVLPTAGRVLEENLGYQKWLHRHGRIPDDHSFERPLDMPEAP